jgi:hypothetical protein
MLTISHALLNSFTIFLVIFIKHGNFLNEILRNGNGMLNTMVCVDTKQKGLSQRELFAGGNMQSNLTHNHHFGIPMC